ncbi:MAG: hypothetical protein ACREV6_10825 [Clostridium sp.]|uniref:hypothetical protein n=1 Tax=Clostridium sp. TaxID=1506 RepID=UPI003D6CDB56
MVKNMVEYLLGGVVAGVIGYFLASIYGVAFVMLLYYIVLCLVKLSNIEKKIDKIINTNHGIVKPKS